MVKPKYIKSTAIDEPLCEFPKSVSTQISTNTNLKSKQLFNIANHTDDNCFSKPQQQVSSQVGESGHDHYLDAAQQVCFLELDPSRRWKVCGNDCEVEMPTVAVLLIMTCVLTRTVHKPTLTMGVWQITIYTMIHVFIKVVYRSMLTRQPPGEQSTLWTGNSQAKSILTYFGHSK